jgi:predicted  nucleic acid-binding Zn-ribbon protein
MAMISERDAERKALKAANEKTEELERTHIKNRNEKFEAERMWRFFEAEYVDMVAKKNAARKELFVANEKIDELENQNTLLEIRADRLYKQLGDEVGELKDERRALADKVVGLEIENDKLRAEKSND